MMTKKNYESAAKVVRNLAEPFRAPSKPDTVKETRRRKEDAKVAAVAFSLFFRDDNPSFDQERFLTACGVGL